MNNTKGSRKTVKAFCIIALSLAAVWFLAGQGLRLRKALLAADLYQERLTALGPVDPGRVEELARLLDSAEKSSSGPKLRELQPNGLQSDGLQPNELQFDGLQSEESQTEDSGAAENAFTQTGIEAIRELLRAAGIRGERLRFSGKDGAQVELALRCETIKFLEFLLELPGRVKDPVNYLSIRAVPDSREADIVMRFNHE